MNYEKKYKEALEKAREIIKDYENRGLKDILFYAKEDFEAIFPELQESEDERISKEEDKGDRTMTREELTNSMEGKVTGLARDWFQDNRDKESMDGFEAGYYAALAEKQELINKATAWIDYNNKNGGCLFDNWKEDFCKYMEKE